MLLPAGAVLTALFLIYPNRTLLFAPFWIVFFFSTGSVSLLALAFLILAPERTARTTAQLPFWMPGSLLVFLLISAFHVFRSAGSCPLNEAMRSFSYVILPLFAFVFRKELLRLLPGFLSALWGVSALLSLLEYAQGHFVLAGLPMNKNWNASLILATAPFALWSAWRFLLLKSRTASFLAAAALIGGVSGFLLFQCRSAGAVLSLAGSLLISFLCSLRNTQIRKLAWTLLLLILLLGSAIALSLLKRGAFQNLSRRNDRMYFFLQTAKLIADSPAAGHGIFRFEQAFLPYRTQDHFSLAFSTDRVNHPHNHFLFLAAGNGLAGLSAYLLFLIFPMLLFAVKSFRREHPLLRICFFSCVLLFLHAQVDLILFQEPTNLLALLLAGLLWGSVFLRRTGISRTLPCRASRTHILAGGLMQTAGGLLLALAFLMAGMNLYASVNFRKGERLYYAGHGREARRYYERALRAGAWDNQYEYLYPAIPVYFTTDRADLEYALSLCKRFDTLPVHDFAHINLYRGRVLMDLGRNTEAEIFLLRDAKLYPLDPRPLLALLEMFLKSGQTEKAKRTDGDLKELLKKLRFDDGDLRRLLSGDLAFDLYRKIRRAP